MKPIIRNFTNVYWVEHIENFVIIRDVYINGRFWYAEFSTALVPKWTKTGSPEALNPKVDLSRATLLGEL